MSDELDEFDLDDEEDDDEGQGNAGLRNARAAAKRAKTAAKSAQQERDALKREAALLRAGIDPETTLGRLYSNSLTGEPGDKATLAAGFAAFREELGIPSTTDTAEVASGEPVAEAPATPTEPNGTDARELLANGAVPVTATNPNAANDLFRQAQAALAEGATFSDAAGGLINGLANAARKGEIPTLIGDGRRPA